MADLEINGRLIRHGERVRRTRQQIQRMKRRLRNSLAIVRDKDRTPRPIDLERWDGMRVTIAALERVLAELLAGGDPPPSPRTGQKTGMLPDRLGEADRDDASLGGSRRDA
jgi:hypothetical protein